MNALTQMKEEFKTLQERIEALNVEMQEKSKVLMKEALRDFFEQYDGVVQNLFWRQYTPYFNDGESCEFSVYDTHITLVINKDEDEDDEDEGSTVYGPEDIARFKETIELWESFNRDPKAEALKYQSYYIQKYKRDPFEADKWSGKTSAQRMNEWTPDYFSLDVRRKQLADAEYLVANYPTLKDDYQEISRLIAGINEDIMKAMFGDHAKVICSKDGIEVEEYQHD